MDENAHRYAVRGKKVEKWRARERGERKREREIGDRDEKRYYHTYVVEILRI